MVTRQGLSHHYSKVSMRLRNCDDLPTEGGTMQAAWILIFAALQATAATPEQAIHKLKATPKTVAWGYYAASTPAALRIRSGDSVEVETLITNSPALLEDAGVPPADIEPALRDIYREVTDKGPRNAGAGHTQAEGDSQNGRLGILRGVDAA